MINTVEEVISITNVDFIAKNVLLIGLSNQRTFFVPLDKFPELLNLTEQEKKDFEIIDNQYLSFLSISEIYSLHDLVGF